MSSFFRQFQRRNPFTSASVSSVALFSGLICYDNLYETDKKEKQFHNNFKGFLFSEEKSKTLCDATPKNSHKIEEPSEPYFYNMFPQRQLWQSKMPHPALWDTNWDGRYDSESEKDKERKRQIRRDGITRHIILIRHGQYDETHKEDEKRLLTPLGRSQAKYTGKRLQEIILGVNEKFGPCNVKVVHVSNMARAKETADIIYSQLKPESGVAVPRTEPDPTLNEGRPCHYIPTATISESGIKKFDEQHPRIESAFQKYFYRADPPPPPSNSNSETEEGATTKDKKKVNEKHEFEIIVCHANVIRYFFCRALQLPPEAWLRLCTFNCSLTYFTIRPTGTVSCRMLGDIGHLPYDHCSFSMHHGFNW